MHLKYLISCWEWLRIRFNNVAYEESSSCTCIKGHVIWENVYNFKTSSLLYDVYLDKNKVHTHVGGELPPKQDRDKRKGFLKIWREG